MMAISTRVKAKIKDGMTTVRAIIRHPMETGFRVDTATRQIVPAHYIKHVVVKHKARVIMSCDWSRAVSKNPYLSFMFKGAEKGDVIELNWIDNKNESDTVQFPIK